MQPQETCESAVRTKGKNAQVDTHKTLTLTLTLFYLLQSAVCILPFRRRVFSVAGLMEWNSPPDSLLDHARCTDFRSALKTHL